MTYSERPNPITPQTDPDLKRANVLAALDMERARQPVRRFDPIEAVDRRIERLEAAIYALTGRLDDVESLAALAQAQAESCSGAW